MPGLEILSDDVRCSHGATNGPVSEDELFYLQARGIPREAASRLIVNGFFNSLLEKLPDPVLREYLMGLVARRLQVS
jgi:Fe-S cluster assembly protein SufD